MPLDPSLEELSQQNPTPLGPPRGLPPPQPTPYWYGRDVQQQQQWPTPGAVAIGGTLADAASRGLQGVNQYIGNVMTSADPTVVEDPAAYGAADLAFQTMGYGVTGAVRGALGIYGGKLLSALSREEVEKLNSWLKQPQHLGEYLGGFGNQKTTKFDFGNNTISIDASLYKDGQFVGYVKRFIRPKQGTAYHGSMSIDDAWKGQGIGKQLSLAHTNVYQKTGIKKTNLLATEDGSSFWAHLGYLPDKYSWEDAIKSKVADRLEHMEVDPQTRSQVTAALQSSDPRAIWTIVDSSVGRKLLYKIPWQGYFDLTNPEQMQRMNLNARR